MAEDFKTWLNGTMYNLKAYADSKIFVIGLVGKDTTENSKVDALNEFLQRQIFQGVWADKEIPIYIEAFFSVEDLTLFLVLNGINEAEAMTCLFGCGKFQDKLSLFEYEYVRRLHLLFVLCHAVIFIEQGCRFDIAVAKYLKNVNQLRLQTQEKVHEALSQLSHIPREWKDESRLAMPRLCFGFYRNPLRADLGAVKKRELIEKMQKHLSGQIYSILKQAHVIETHSGTSLCSLSDNAVPFVHIFRPNEAPIDYLNEFITAMIIEDRKPDFCKALDDDRRDRYEKRRSPENIEDFNGFIHALIDDSLEIGDRSDVFFKFPKLKHFTEGAQVVYDILMNDESISEVELKGMFVPELTMVESLDDAILRSAIAFYKKDLDETGRAHDAATRGYSKKEHLEKLQQATNYLKSHVTGDNLPKFTESLIEQCNQIWTSGHQRCEAVSLTGNMCRYSSKKHPTIELSRFSKFGSKMDDDKENLLHSSGIRYLSTCNCGRTQMLRNDPFGLKDANFDFYEQFHCCKNTERYEFPIFEPREAQEALESVEDESSESTESDGDGTSSNETEETSDEEKSSQRNKSTSPIIKKTSSGMSSPKPEDFDQAQRVIADADDDSRMEYHSRYLDEEKLIQMIHGETKEKKKSGRRRVRPEAKSESDRQSDEEQAEVEGSDEDDDEEHISEKQDNASDEAEDDEEIEEEERDFDTEKPPSETAEEEAPVGDYLDTYDANLKVNVPKEATKTDDSNQEYNELLKKYKGHYLEHLPHSSITSGLFPLFPSWAVVCVGPSNLYCHASGLRDQPNFKAGSEYLLPLDVHLNVVSEQWEADMRKIAPTSERNYRRTPRRRLEEDPIAGTNREKVKFFVGFDYECPRGHRFMVQEPNKVLRHRRSNGNLKETATNLVRSDIPIWMPCTCKREPLVAAQLMRLHIVTPKAPVTLTLNPKVMVESHGYFHMGDSDVDLTWAKYYVLRFPYVYVGPNGPVHPPKMAETKGSLLKNCFTVAHTPVA
uniref:Nonsense-mediated mRNA decay factor SMG8 n=1 Tax=Acrobeloides nanus TaxID=290746 RepID=A0A914DSB0_9BILA